MMEAINWFRRSIEANPNQLLTHFVLAAALALVGSVEEAKAVANVIIRASRFVDIARAQWVTTPVYLEMRERLFEGMRIAGIPEG